MRCAAVLIGVSTTQFANPGIIGNLISGHSGANQNLE